VRGYDPAVPGSTHDPATAVAGADVVLSVNAARVAVEAAHSALGALAADALYADLNTAAPALKRELAALVGTQRFADVALLGPVQAKGISTRALASGPGAQTFAQALGPVGMPVQVVSGQPGDAAAMKLVRSVFMKGLAASAVESMRAAEEAGCADWLADEIADVIGRPLLARLLEGSRAHAARRVDEMEAAAELLRELGVEPRVARASAELLADLDEGEA
jgi:3-hydroxyisobutyrate dehydrogenase-like beta-hydroxyacid dehydrogenase